MLSILNIFLNFLISFFIFLCQLREIHFWAELHQINRARFYQEQLAVNVRRSQKRSCFPTSGVVVENFSRSVNFLPWRGLFSVYRAVNTTNSDRGNCSGCECGYRAVCRSSCNIRSMDWNLPHVQRNDAATSDVTLQEPGLLSITDGAELQTQDFLLFFFPLLYNFTTHFFNLGSRGRQNHSRCNETSLLRTERNLSSSVDQPKDLIYNINALVSSIP